jgi:hypothetical protein
MGLNVKRRKITLRVAKLVHTDPQLAAILGARLDIVVAVVDKTRLEIGKEPTNTPNFTDGILEMISIRFFSKLIAFWRRQHSG